MVALGFGFFVLWLWQSCPCLSLAQTLVLSWSCPLSPGVTFTDNLAKHTFIFKFPSWVLSRILVVEYNILVVVVLLFLFLFLFLLMSVTCRPGLMQLIWLAKRRPLPPSLLHVHPSQSCMPGQRGRLSLNRGGPVFSQGYRSSYVPMLEPPNKLSKNTTFLVLRGFLPLVKDVLAVLSLSLPESPGTGF